MTHVLEIKEEQVIQDTLMLSLTVSVSVMHIHYLKEVLNQ